MLLCRGITLNGNCNAELREINYLFVILNEMKDLRNLFTELVEVYKFYTYSDVGSLTELGNNEILRWLRMTEITITIIL